MSRSYPRKATPTTSDLCMIWDSANSQWALATTASVADLYASENTPLLEPNTQYSSPTADPFSVAVTSNDEDTHFILQTGSVEGTVVFPLNTGLRDKQKLIISSINAIPTLTLDTNGASGIYGEITSIDAGGYVTYKYDLVNDAWFIVG